MLLRIYLLTNVYQSMLSYFIVGFTDSWIQSTKITGDIWKDLKEKKYCTKGTAKVWSYVAVSKEVDQESACHYSEYIVLN